MDHIYYKGLDEKARLSSQKKPLKLTKSFTGAVTKRLRDAVSTKLRKEKASYYSDQLCEKKDSRELWKTLNELLPNKKQHKTVNAPASENFKATSFNEFFTSGAEKLCGHYKSKTRLPYILTPRVAQNFVLQKVSSNFVLKELTKLKVTKASDPDAITARLMKDAAPVIAKPITYLVNLTISSGLILAEWKDVRVTPSFKSGARKDVTNYRPISVLPLVSKIMKRAIQVQF